MGWGKLHQMMMFDEFYLCGNAIYVDKYASVCSCCATPIFKVWEHRKASLYI
jgi:hypothetical protein